MPESKHFDILFECSFPGYNQELFIFIAIGATHTARCAVARASAFFVLFVFQKREYSDTDQNKDHCCYNDRYRVFGDPRKHDGLLLSLYFHFLRKLRCFLILLEEQHIDHQSEQDNGGGKSDDVYGKSRTGRKISGK